MAPPHRDGRRSRTPHRGPGGRGQRGPSETAKLPAGTWEVTVWEPPSYFEWSQKTGGVTSVAGHRVEALESERTRLSLSLEMRGLLVPIVGLFSRGMVRRYMTLEAQGMKTAAESQG